MLKLIKRYQDGGETSNETKKKKNPNTENVGADEGKGFFNKIGGWDTIGRTSDILGSLIPAKKSSEVQVADKAFDAASDVMMTVNPMVGSIIKAGGFLSDSLNALGIRTDQATGLDKLFGSKFMSLTPVGLLNNAFSSKLDSLSNDVDTADTLARAGGGYNNFLNNWESAKKYSGKSVGLLNSKSSLNSKIYAANHQYNQLYGILGNQRQNDLLAAQMGDRWNERTINDMNGGFGNISFGRLGLKIEILDKVHSILNAPKVLDTLTELEDEVPEFKEGGKMNVIPEGSLHARLHHMENAEGLTKKGIPVVSEMEGGELEQQAEIELNEIIFTLEVTQELEKLMEDGSDNAAIEAGKLLVKEIFENTDDRTGLLKQLEPEKKESTTEDIVKKHQVFQEGGKL